MVLTSEALEHIQDEGFEFFETIEEYVKYIFDTTNFHDGMVMLKALERKLETDYILAQDELYFVANADNIYLDVESFLEDTDFEGEMFEEN